MEKGIVIPKQDLHEKGTILTYWKKGKQYKYSIDSNKEYIHIESEMEEVQYENKYVIVNLLKEKFYFYDEEEQPVDILNYNLNKGVIETMINESMVNEFNKFKEKMENQVKENFKKEILDEVKKMLEEKENQYQTEILFAKTRPDAKIPSKESENMGYDIYACFDEDYIVIRRESIVFIPTGIVSAFSEDYGIILKERGSTGSKGLSLRCGVIDSGFRAEWKVILNNTSDKTIIITKDMNKEEYIDEYGVIWGKGKNAMDSNFILYDYNKAICQAILHEVPKAKITEKTLEEVKSISSKRGEGMLGSSGK